MNTGIDYGLGKTNINLKTGIRFGVIPINACNQDAVEDIYQGGTDLDYEAFMDEAKSKIRSALSDYFSDHKFSDEKHSKLDLVTDEAFEAVSDRLGSNYEPTGDCTRMEYRDSGYKIQTDSSGDLWVFESAYFTYAQFCSPCAPGACYLTNPLDEPNDSNKCYCLGADWFEDNKAPYPVYSVETGKPIA